MLIHSFSILFKKKIYIYIYIYIYKDNFMGKFYSVHFIKLIQIDLHSLSLIFTDIKQKALNI
jgi:hypothetical protein